MNIKRGKALRELQSATEATEWWGWWSKRTGGFHCGMLYGHRIHAIQDNPGLWYLSQNGCRGQEYELVSFTVKLKRQHA